MDPADARHRTAGAPPGAPLTLPQEEADRLAVALREVEARRQESHTRYLEARGRSQ